MSEQYKFRAWDRKLQSMSFPTPREAMRMVSLPEDFDVMMCTGLKDKYGKDIYVGDILRYDSDLALGLLSDMNEPMFSRVVWNYGFCLETDDEGFLESIRDMMNLDGTMDEEIIGNVYQNSPYST